jgi:hypothetical protein
MSQHKNLNSGMPIGRALRGRPVGADRHSEFRVRRAALPERCVADVNN